MAVTLFILGRPGTGKSKAARQIVELAENQGLSIKRINDFRILQNMCYGEHALKFERHAGQQGFDVLDFAVLDVALKEVQVQALEAMKMHDIVIIEFARANYSQALSQFKVSFLMDAFFIFLDSDADTCVERIHRRVENPSTSDDYPVSEKIFSNYYRKRLFPVLLKLLLVFRFILRWDRVLTIKNSGTLNQFTEQIADAVSPVLAAARDEQRQPVLQPSLSAFERTERILESVSEHAAKLSAFFL